MQATSTQKLPTNKDNTPYLTTNQGTRVYNNDHSLTVGTRGGHLILYRDHVRRQWPLTGLVMQSMGHYRMRAILTWSLTTPCIIPIVAYASTACRVWSAWTRLSHLTNVLWLRWSLRLRPKPKAKLCQHAGPILMEDFHLIEKLQQVIVVAFGSGLAASRACSTSRPACENLNS